MALYVKDLPKPCTAATQRENINQSPRDENLEIAADHPRHQQNSDVLGHIHKMRMNFFDKRTSTGVFNEKPYVPML